MPQFAHMFFVLEMIQVAIKPLIMRQLGKGKPQRRPPRVWWESVKGWQDEGMGNLAHASDYFAYMPTPHGQMGQWLSLSWLFCISEFQLSLSLHFLKLTWHLQGRGLKTRCLFEFHFSCIEVLCWFHWVGFYICPITSYTFSNGPKASEVDNPLGFQGTWNLPRWFCTFLTHCATRSCNVCIFLPLFGDLCFSFSNVWTNHNVPKGPGSHLVSHLVAALALVASWMGIEQLKPLLSKCWQKLFGYWSRLD